MIELRQPLPLDTPRGPAFAHFIIDYGTEHHLMWVCFLKESGECWTFANPDIRLEANFTLCVRVDATKSPLTKVDATQLPKPGKKGKK